jgi:tRNA-Thr(GGU) m(6)t(6)A37 methyltransferase TsaA
MEKIEFSPIAYVSNDRNHMEDDDWGDVVSEIRLQESFSEELLMGLDAFSHIEVIFLFHRIPAGKEVPSSRHPRNNPSWPKLGLLAQRSAYHPNQIGLCTAKILRVEGSVVTVQGLDAVDGSPILDIKPVFKEFLPVDTKQPQWVSELMKDYWKKSEQS